MIREYLRDKIRSLGRIFREFIYGATVYDLYRETKKIARDYRESIYLLLLGEMLGIPLLSNYYSLRILPYLIKDLEEFKKEMLKDKDLTDLLGEIEGG